MVRRLLLFPGIVVLAVLFSILVFSNTRKEPDTAERQQLPSKEKALYVDEYGEYELSYPSHWRISGPVGLGKEVTIKPPNPEPFVGYFGILKELTPASSFTPSLHSSTPGTVKQVSFRGNLAYEITHDRNPKYRRLSIIQNGGVFSLYTSRFDLKEVQEIFDSLQFTN